MCKLQLEAKRPTVTQWMYDLNCEDDEDMPVIVAEEDIENFISFD